MKNAFFFLIITVMLVACMNQKNGNAGSSESNKNALIEADKAFSTLSGLKGMKHAFIEYMDSNATVLRPGRLPITGATAVDYLIQQADSDYTLTWEPQYADAAASGELGYTYGVYELRLILKDTTLYGSYINIWKKQQDGKWKYVLNTGNQGVSDE